MKNSNYVFYSPVFKRFLTLNGNFKPGRTYLYEVSGIKLGAVICLRKSENLKVA